MISAKEFLRNHPAVAHGAGTDADGIDGDAEDTSSPLRSRPPRSSRWGRGAAAAEDPADADACREAALRLLDSAARSSGTLRERLLDKGYDGDVVERTIGRLAELRLIDDRDYAESVVRSCVGRMMGRRGTVMELERKGVERALAERVADEAERRGVFEDSAWELGRRVAQKTRGLDIQIRRRRLWSAGGRKGHDPETLRRVAMELLS